MTTLYNQTINFIKQTSDLSIDTKKLTSKMSHLIATAIENLDSDSDDFQNTLMELYLTAVKMDLVVGESNMKKFFPSGNKKTSIGHELKRDMLVDSLIKMSKSNGEKNSLYAIALNGLESIFEEKDVESLDNDLDDELDDLEESLDYNFDDLFDGSIEHEFVDNSNDIFDDLFN